MHFRYGPPPEKDSAFFCASQMPAFTVPKTGLLRDRGRRGRPDRAWGLSHGTVCAPRARIELAEMLRVASGSRDPLPRSHFYASPAAPSGPVGDCSENEGTGDIRSPRNVACRLRAPRVCAIREIWGRRLVFKHLRVHCGRIGGLLRFGAASFAGGMICCSLGHWVWKFRKRSQHVSLP